MFQVEIKVDSSEIKGMEKQLIEGVKKGLKQAVFYVEGKAKEDYGKHGLKVGTGRLRGSIRSWDKGEFHYQVGSDLPYAGVHEFGGTIRAKNGKSLRFLIGGTWKSVKSVTIPKRPFIEPAVSDNIDDILDILGTMIEKELR